MLAQQPSCGSLRLRSCIPRDFRRGALVGRGRMGLTRAAVQELPAKTATKSRVEEYNAKMAERMGWLDNPYQYQPEKGKFILAGSAHSPPKH
jgi:hypothetical protein